MKKQCIRELSMLFTNKRTICNDKNRIQQIFKKYSFYPIQNVIMDLTLCPEVDQLLKQYQEATGEILEHYNKDNEIEQWDTADAKDETKDIPPFPYHLEELPEISSEVIESVIPPAPTFFF